MDIPRNIYLVHYCECAWQCGQITSHTAKFIRGHYGRILPKPTAKLCACGCGRHIFGKQQCVKGHRVNRKQSEYQKSIAREEMHKRWSDPQYAIAERARLAQMREAFLASPELKEKARINMVICKNTDIGKQQNRDIKKLWWQEPINREKGLAMLAKGRRTIATMPHKPLSAASKVRISQAAVRRWADPKFRAKVQAIFGSESHKERLVQLFLSSKHSRYQKFATKRLNGYRTSIEAQVERILQSLGITYEFEKQIGRKFVDFAIVDKKIAIEVDGTYWHKPDSDAKKNQYLEEREWIVIRILDAELKDDVSAVETKLKDAVLGV